MASGNPDKDKTTRKTRAHGPGPSGLRPAIARLWPFLLVALAGVLLPIALGVYARQIAADAFETNAAEMNRTAADATARLVESEFYHMVHTLDGFSRLPNVVDAARARDEDAMRLRIKVFVEANPRINRVIVTDPDARLWSDYPRAPEIMGKRFDDYDWYRGVSANWQPHVSTVYRQLAAPQLLVVAVAVPIIDPDNGKVLAAFVWQMPLDALTTAIQSTPCEDGCVVVLDREGNVASHPELDLHAAVHTEYVGSAPFAAGTDEPVEYEDPITGEPMLAAVARCDVPGGAWTVVAQQPAAEARAPVRAITMQIAITASLVTLFATGFCVLLLRGSVRHQVLNRALDASNTKLAGEIVVRRKAEQDLLVTNEKLAQRVETGERNLRDTEEKLAHAQKMEAVGRLAGGIAHDFNNLLSVIIGFAQIVLDGLPADSPLRADIAEIRSAGDRAATLTRQLLAFSRKQVMQPVVLDINEVVANMDKMLKRLIGEDVQLVTVLAPQIGTTRVDPGQLEQVIVNLAINARDAMPHGGKLTIETGIAELDTAYITAHPDAKSGSHVFLAVSDTGVGMDAATQEKIFEPFFTTKAAGRGTGLGLSTVYGIVKQSGGTIWVYSELGRGTTFKIYLPMTQEDVTRPRRPTIEVATGGTETVLVVEDEPGVRRLVQQVLEGAGYTVLIAHDGNGALEVFGKNPGVQLLLTDVVLPGMGGPAIAAALKQQNNKLKVLFMSGYTANAIVHDGVLDQGLDFIEKPLRPDALLKKIRATLDA